MTNTETIITPCESCGRPTRTEAPDPGTEARAVCTGCQMSDFA